MMMICNIFVEGASRKPGSIAEQEREFAEREQKIRDLEEKLKNPQIDWEQWFAEQVRDAQAPYLDTQGSSRTQSVPVEVACLPPTANPKDQTKEFGFAEATNDLPAWFSRSQDQLDTRSLPNIGYGVSMPPVLPTDDVGIRQTTNFKAPGM